MSEKYASCPTDGKILSYYAGQFEAVYVLLHPFVRPESIDGERFCPEKWPTKQEIISGCSSITWLEILNMAGFLNISEIDIGLRTIIGGIAKKHVNEHSAKKLLELTDDLKIIRPTEGELPPLIENRIFNVIKNLGYESLWVSDEFGTEKSSYQIDYLIENDKVPGHGCIFTHDHNLLVTTHWDSHCSFLCSTRETIEEILELDSFEGFFSTAKTEVYWGAYEI